MYGDHELYHHGIIGQKWGIRRTPEELGHRVSSTARSVGKSVAKVSKAYAKKMRNTGKKVYAKIKARNPKNWTDEELRSKIERLKLENQYYQELEKNVSPSQKKRAAAVSSAKKGAVNITKRAADEALKVGNKLIDTGINTVSRYANLAADVTKEAVIESVKGSIKGEYDVKKSRAAVEEKGKNDRARAAMEHEWEQQTKERGHQVAASMDLGSVIIPIDARVY